jgi:hypothetical protein
MKKYLQRGAATVEMTLVGIPIIFTLISIFEISRGMWNYHTLAYAVKEGVRFAIVHGKDCGTVGPIVNTCTKTAAQVADVIRNAGVGLDPSATTVKFFSGIAGGGALTLDATCTLAGTQVGVGTSCASQWPPEGSNGAGTNVVEIDVITPFYSALAMFWPGSSPVSFAVVNFGASSSEVIQF